MGYRWLRWSSERIGHRLTGSAQGAMAEAAADSLFRVSGLPQVMRFPFRAQAWSRGTVQLTVGDGEGFLHLQAVALANTPLSAAGGCAIARCGQWAPADLDRLGETAQKGRRAGEHRASGGHRRRAICTAARRRSWPWTAGRLRSSS
ncbi:MAG: hypothetical protein IPF41_03880 [Flavobacteriales bacterium]|nr:hypothetical protein [Flavobacteriales bacterium]